MNRLEIPAELAAVVTRIARRPRAVPLPSFTATSHTSAALDDACRRWSQHLSTYSCNARDHALEVRRFAAEAARIDGEFWR